MKTKGKLLHITLAISLLLFIPGVCLAQDVVRISGEVNDANADAPLPGVNILVKGKVIGTVTDKNGSFSLEVQDTPPITLQFTYVGFQPQEVVVNEYNLSGITISLEEQVLQGREVVVSASRVEESIQESPVSIEKMGIMDIRQTAADGYYNAIASLKGVDISTSSIGFQIINARGFNSTGNTRFVQLIDGMDTQAPGLNFPIGNLNGPSELDVESVELIPGTASALYGPNAFNGVILITSKSPFEYQGLSTMAKYGMNHFNGSAIEPANPQPVYETAIRYGKSINDRFAFKVNLSYFQAQDLHGIDNSDLATERQGNLSFNPGADIVHEFGDAAATNIALLGFNPQFQNVASGISFNGKTAADYIGDIPSQVVSRTPYPERFLVDYNAKNLKASSALHYRLTDKMEAIYHFNYGSGTSVYTGANRYSLNNFFIHQHKLELNRDNFFLRGYTTQERSGDSYIADFSALQINREWALKNAGLTDEGGNPLPGVSLEDGDGVWFSGYTLGYLGVLAGSGLAPGEINNLPEEQRNALQSQAHTIARDVADQGRYEPGSPDFNRAKERYQGMVITQGSKFNDATNLYHVEGQYDFKNQVEFMGIQVGGNYRLFDLNSNGTIFADTTGNDLSIAEYGTYVQGSKKLLAEKLKLTGSVRYDKNENFEGQFSPRIASVYNIGKAHYVRTSFQTGFRNPTTQAQHIDLNVGAMRILSGLAPYARAYNIYDNAYTLESVNNYVAAISDEGTPLAIVNPANMALLKQVTSYDPVKAEQVRAVEVGYKSLINEKLMIDAAYYYNWYEDFIVLATLRKAAGNVSENPVYASTLLSGNDQNTFSVYTNMPEQVTAQGAVLGINYALPGNYTIGGNYNWNRLNKDFGGEFLNDFNTPQHKFNLSFGNRRVWNNLGFFTQLRWQDQFYWNSSFARGEVPAYHTVDAQLSYKLVNLKSTFKLGGSNILNNRYIQNFGGPTIGALYYLSVTFDEMMH